MRVARYYQADCVAKSLRWLRGYAGEKRGCLVEAATGGGKTLIAGELCARLLADSTPAAPVRILIIAHREILVSQMAGDVVERFRELGVRHSISVEMGEERGKVSTDVVVASTQSLGIARRLARWPQNHFSLIIFDEAHETVSGNKALAILAHFRTARLLGLSATFTSESKQRLAPFFETDPVASWPYHVLKAHGWLADWRLRHAPIDVKIEGGREGVELSETKEAELLKGLVDDAARRLVSVTPAGEITLVSCPSVGIADAFADKLRELGQTAAAVHSKLGTENPETLRDFDGGQIQYLCICDMLRIGWDPKCNLRQIALFRIIKSKDRFLQLIGRATRLFGIDYKTFPAAEEDADKRLAIIAEGAKPNFFITDLIRAFDSKHHRLLSVGVEAIDPDSYEAAAEMKGVGESLDRNEGKTKDELLELDKAFDEALTAAVEQRKISEEQAHAYLADFNLFIATLNGHGGDKPLALRKLRGLIKRLMKLCGIHDYRGAKSVLKHLAKKQEAVDIQVRELTPDAECVGVCLWITKNFEKRKPDKFGKLSVHWKWAFYHFCNLMRVDCENPRSLDRFNAAKELCPLPLAPRKGQAWMLRNVNFSPKTPEISKHLNEIR